jgi:hypothetical protein
VERIIPEEYLAEVEPAQADYLVASLGPSRKRSVSNNQGPGREAAVEELIALAKSPLGRIKALCAQVTERALEAH